jgi:mono/diheme cytochrome c family protein
MVSSSSNRWLALVLVACCPLACQQKMATQPSAREDEPSSFFADGRAARPAVPGTVARGHLRTDKDIFGFERAPEGAQAAAAMLSGAAGVPFPTIAVLEALRAAEENIPPQRFPFAVTAQVLQHGQERFQIYCAVCHDPLGTGHGVIVERGYTPPPTFHSDRLRSASVGHIFEVITRGYGSMPSYREQIPARDRWAIIAYVRALQLSQHFPEGNLPPDMRRDWAKQAGGAP